MCEYGGIISYKNHIYSICYCATHDLRVHTQTLTLCSRFDIWVGMVLLTLALVFITHRRLLQSAVVSIPFKRSNHWRDSNVQNLNNRLSSFTLTQVITMLKIVQIEHSEMPVSVEVDPYIPITVRTFTAPIGAV